MVNYYPFTIIICFFPSNNRALQKTPTSTIDDHKKLSAIDRYAHILRQVQQTNNRLDFLLQITIHMCSLLKLNHNPLLPGNVLTSAGTPDNTQEIQSIVITCSNIELIKWWLWCQWHFNDLNLRSSDNLFIERRHRQDNNNMVTFRLK